MSRTPLFQAMLTLQHAPPAVRKIEGLQRRAMSADSGTAKTDLALVFVESSGGLGSLGVRARPL